MEVVKYYTLKPSDTITEFKEDKNANGVIKVKGFPLIQTPRLIYAGKIRDHFKLELDRECKESSMFYHWIQDADEHIFKVFQEKDCKERMCNISLKTDSVFRVFIEAEADPSPEEIGVYDENKENVGIEKLSIGDKIICIIKLETINLGGIQISTGWKLKQIKIKNNKKEKKCFI